MKKNKYFGYFNSVLPRQYKLPNTKFSPKG